MTHSLTDRPTGDASASKNAENTEAKEERENLLEEVELHRLASCWERWGFVGRGRSNSNDDGWEITIGQKFINIDKLNIGVVISPIRKPSPIIFGH